MKVNFSVQTCIRCARTKPVTKFPARFGTDLCLKCRSKARRLERRVSKIKKQAKPQKQIWADELRKNMTPAELHLWEVLRKMSPLFLPQQVIFGYIADFLCPNFRVLVEVDGSSHDCRQQYDEERDRNLKRKQYRTLRFTNEQVMSNRPSVVAAILEAL